jgi:hypothetical protein
MPIFITRTVNFKTKVDAFERRGLDNQGSAKVSDLAIQVVSAKPLQNVLRYSHMSSELNGRLVGTTTKYEEHSRAVLRRFSGDGPFEAPTLVVEMKSGGEVLNSCGLYEVAASKQAIYSGKPTVEQFKTICQQGIDFYQTIPAGNVNIAGFVAYVQAWRGITAFFAVGGGDVDSDGGLKAWLTPEGAKGLLPKEAIPAVQAADGSLVREARAGKEGGGWVTVDTPYLMFATGAKPAYEGIPTLPAHEQNLDFGGLLFPYFPEMIEPDVEFAFQVFISLYALCLESEEDKTAEAIAVHRRGFRYLANSHAGRIIQHVYLGVKLAIDSGAMLVLVKDGSEYAGFMLKGENFRVSVQNRVYQALSSKDLSTELATLDTHNQALRDLWEVLIAMSRIGGAEEERTFEEFAKNPRVMREMIQARDPEVILAKRAVITELIADIKFRQEFWEVTKANVCRFLTAMVYKYPLIDEPMYLHIDVLCNRSSDILAYLSVFGVQAPSVYHGSKTLGIGRPGEEDPNLKVEDGKRKVPHIPFVVKGLTSAALDWASVYKQKAFRFTPAETKFGGRGFSSAKKRDGYVDNPDFERFYDELRKWVYTGVDAPVKVGKKRKSAGGEGDSDMAEGAGNKKKTRFVFV